MNEKTKAIIAEKREQIRALKREIADLEDKSIGSFICNDILGPIDGGCIGGVRELRPYRTGNTAWRHIVNASMEVYRHRVRALGVDLKQANLTKDQKKAAAKLCDEMIEAYNKYVIKEYGQEYAVPREYVEKYTAQEAHS